MPPPPAPFFASASRPGQGSFGCGSELGPSKQRGAEALSSPVTGSIAATRTHACSFSRSSTSTVGEDVTRRRPVAVADQRPSSGATVLSTTTAQRLASGPGSQASLRIWRDKYAFGAHAVEEQLPPEGRPAQQCEAALATSSTMIAASAWVGAGASSNTRGPAPVWNPSVSLTGAPDANGTSPSSTRK